MSAAVVLLRYVWPYLLAAAVAACAAWYVQGLRLDVVRADLRTANDRIAILDASNRQCAADVAETRMAVQAIKRAAEERERAAAATQAAAEAQAAESDKRASDLASRRPSSPDGCQAAADFTADYFKGRGK